MGLIYCIIGKEPAYAWVDRFIELVFYICHDLLWAAFTMNCDALNLLSDHLAPALQTSQ